MYLSKLSLLNFKNYLSSDIDLCSRINCFVGLNGVGKTNLLDAIYYLSFCKSNFNPIDTENIHFGEEFFMIQGSYVTDFEEFIISCGVKKNQKKSFRKNKKRILQII
jgi:DNA replication and repair protein RecF